MTLWEQVKEALTYDQRQLVGKLLQQIEKAAYDKGYVDGLHAYSWMKDGTYFVGTCGKSLKHALEDRKRASTYDPENVRWE